jgi:hypothetical protein
MVNILPFRNPLLVAEEAAMLDILTGGRLDLGLGRGLRPPEFEAFGVDQAQSRETFVEVVQSDPPHLGRPLAGRSPNRAAELAAEIAELQKATERSELRPGAPDPAT